MFATFFLQLDTLKSGARKLLVGLAGQHAAEVQAAASEVESLKAEVERLTQTVANAAAEKVCGEEK